MLVTEEWPSLFKQMKYNPRYKTVGFHGLFPGGGMSCYIRRQSQTHEMEEKHMYIPTINIHPWYHCWNRSDQKLSL